VADEYGEYEEEEAPPPRKPKPPRKPIDWPLVIMLVGTLVFLLVFGLITAMAPRRPFLVVRSGQGARPAATAVGAPPGASSAPNSTPGAPAPASKP
jgi:hypothetical protein